MNSIDLLQLYNGQLQEFELAKKNYTDLQQAVYRDIPFDLFRLRIQYNPARMISTNARIDVRTLQNRKCFLCREHMPEAQKGIRYNDRYSIFINPYPIFVILRYLPATMNLNASGDDLKTCWISLSIFRGIPYFITVPLAALLPRTIFTFKCARGILCLWKKMPPMKSSAVIW